MSAGGRDTENCIKISRGRYIGLICAIVMLLLGMLLITARVFWGGNVAAPSDLNYSVSVEENTVNFSGDLRSSASGVARISFEYMEEAGMVTATVRTAPKAFFNSSEFAAQYQAPGEVVMVRCGDWILWERGTEIGPGAAQLYEAFNPYVGDMPANGRIASILGIADQLGPYANELQTSQEPYGWTLVLETQVAWEEEDAARNIMAADSCAMLATVGNLGYVTWKYNTEAGPQEYTITEEDAFALVGKEIKSCGVWPTDLQELLQSLSLKWAGVRDVFQENGAFLLKVRNNSDAEIYGLTVHYYLNEEAIGSCGFSNGDNTPLKEGGVASFDFVTTDFPEGASAIQLSSFVFDLAVVDENGRETTVCKQMRAPAKYKWTYFYTLSGDYEQGFVLDEG